MISSVDLGGRTVPKVLGLILIVGLVLQLKLNLFTRLPIPQKYIFLKKATLELEPPLHLEHSKLTGLITLAHLSMEHRISGL